MRLVIVSAHYPPDFTSGATLVAQRTARGAARAGHEVHLYAGWIGGGRPDAAERKPMESWEEVDEAGVRIRWVATHPWLGWEDQANFDNPRVADDFGRYLAEVKPDLVHFQVLQTMGAALVPVAKRSGAATVVTMHDFWWLCTRLFLVDKALRPCSVVVDGGNCECEAGVGWRQERAAFMRRALDHADLVLAPSAPAASVLAANGVAPGRLEVDENGVGDLPSRLTRTRRGQMRIAYLGGREPLKGWDVLVEAARRLSHCRRFEIWAYGAIGESPEDEARLATLGIVTRPAFPPSDLARVLASVDAVVVPSIMRETFSLATREALAAGVAVICTDSIGPEEVVVQGYNGLVVPAGDPGALADAIAALSTEEGLLERLWEGAAQTPSPPSAEEQVSRLLDSYARLVARVGKGGAEVLLPDKARSVSPAGGAGIKRVLFVCGIDGAPLRYRAWLPAEGLALAGISTEVRHYRDPEVPRLAFGADVVVAYRVPATWQILETFARCRSLGIVVLFDVDDLIFEPELASEIPALSLLPAEEAELWMQGVRRYRSTMEACDGFIASTDALADHARAATGLPVYRFDNGVGMVAARDADAALARGRSPGPVRIGYLSGTNTHGQDWAMVEPAVARVLGRHPEAELWLVGHIEPGEALAPFSHRVRRIGMMPWRELFGVLADLDVNLAPVVESSRFNHAKSAIKWLEAALVETPTVASRTVPFQQAIEEGRNGLLASSEDEWFSGIDALVEHPGLRRRLGSAARRDALVAWSFHLQGERYRAILEQAVATGPLWERKSTWEVVALDEPPQQGVHLEPYPWQVPASGVEVAAPSAPPSAGPGPRLSSRAADLVRRGASRAREQGLGSAAGAAVRMLRRKVTHLEQARLGR